MIASSLVAPALSGRAIVLSFSLSAAPTVSSLGTSSGTTAGGTVITITTNFTDVTEVTFGDIDHGHVAGRPGRGRQGDGELLRWRSHRRQRRHRHGHRPPPATLVVTRA